MDPRKFKNRLDSYFFYSDGLETISMGFRTINKYSIRVLVLAKI
jgi:hypothetical protein